MTSRDVVRGILAAGLAVTFQLAMGQIPLAQQATPPPVAPAAGAPQAPGAPPPQAGRGGGRGSVDPRVQQRTYTFADSNEQMPYALFVSSKVTKDKKSPLIVSLHGLGGDQNTMVRESLRSVELAEQGGYILLAPMGYNSGGWYGIPPGPPRGGGANPNAAAQPGRGAGGRGAGGRGAVTAGGTAITEPAKVREASEKDVMTVLAMVRKEFNVDDRRIYLMGHSMGGAGTYYLGSKYGKEFAALAPIAPAAMGMTNDRTKVLQAIKDAGVPMLVSMGDADEAVPVANVRMWVDTMKELQMNYEYTEYPGVTHGPIMGASMEAIYTFFARHSKPAGR
jgi:predicted esterase